MNVRSLDWRLFLIVITALAGQASLTIASPQQPLLLPVIRQTSFIDCGLAALAMLLRDKASITTSVAALDNLAAVLIDPKTAAIDDTATQSVNYKRSQGRSRTHCRRVISH